MQEKSTLRFCPVIYKWKWCFPGGGGPKSLQRLRYRAYTVAGLPVKLHTSEPQGEGEDAMKIGRSLGIGVIVLLAVVVAALIYILSSLDALVAGAIQKYGSQVTQTPVRVSSVSIDLKSGAGSIEQLTVGNPDGFSAPDIFTLGGIDTRLDLTSVRKDPVVIEEIHIASPAVFYEINKSGASNINELQKNIDQSAGGADKPDTPEDDAGPRVIIRKLLIEDGEIHANVAALGDKPLSARLPRIQLNSIGEKSGGATGGEVARQVLEAIIARVGPAVANLGLDKYVGKSLDEAKSRLDEKVGESLGDKATEGAGGLRKLLDR
jgi:hypothetical protein